MASPGWGRCPQCKNPHKTLLQRGLCAECMQRNKEKTAQSRVEVLRKHPDLAELELILDNWYD